MTTTLEPGPASAAFDLHPATPPSRSAFPAPRAAWERPALAGLLGVTAILYLWGLSNSGWANAFYAAAVQAGSVSWKAFFFGASDAAGSITVDKTPLSLWVMALSARVFGMNSWSMLVPQALIGAASVGLLYSTVRRWFTPAAGLIAGAVLALTPVAVLMFKFNNPDALLVLLLIAAVWATQRALERAGTRWLLLAAAFVGLGFLTKMLQALLVLPALALVYLIAAPTPLRRRLVQLLAAFASLIVSAGWWVAIVSLIPAADRPYIGGSQNNSILELTLGYNGFGRLTGNETGSVGGGRGWGSTGLLRMFGSDIGGQVAWLLPASLILLVAGLWLTRRAPRTDRSRAALGLWGLWLLVTGLTFSLMAGIFHAYYTIALAPAIGALVGIGLTLAWQHRRALLGRLVLATTLAATAWTSWLLLDRSADFLPWLRWVVLMAGFAIAASLLLVHQLGRRTALALASAGIVVGLAGPAAYSIDTAFTAHTGSIPSAGPAVAGGGFGPGGIGGGPGGFPGGGFPGGPTGQTGQPGVARGPGGGGAGGLLNASTPSAELTAALQADADSYTWVAAAVGAQTAAGYQLATGDSVMPIGGFNGSDPSPTLAQFQQDVAAGKIHYFISGGMGGMRGGPGGQQGGSNTSSSISSWVTANFTATTIGGVTLYDLTQPT